MITGINTLLISMEECDIIRFSRATYLCLSKWITTKVCTLLYNNEVKGGKNLKWVIFRKVEQYHNSECH